MLINRKFSLDDATRLEGGYAERDTEGGGAVNHGITFTVFKAWEGLHGRPDATWGGLKALTVDGAIEIYEAQFLTGIRFDDLPSGVDHVMLDSAIIGGVAGATRILQKALGFTKGADDGHLGLVTMWAVKHRDPATLVNRISDTRLVTYKTFRNWGKVANAAGKTWGEIWTARIAAVRKAALALAAKSETPATVEPAKPAPVPDAPRPSLPAAVLYKPRIAKFQRITLELQSFTPAEFRYFTEEIAPARMMAWRPQGVVLHCTAQPSLADWIRDTTVRGIDPLQRIENMMPRWAQEGFSASPHLFITPTHIITATPLWRKGTHAKSFNATYWGDEIVGDFTKEKISDAHKDTVVTAVACQYAMIGVEPTPKNLKFHREEPHTSKPCPGDIGPKEWWDRAIEARMAELFPGDHYVRD